MACREIAFSKLLILFCYPGRIRAGLYDERHPGALFLPWLVPFAFSMITSYLMAQTFVPVMAN